MEQKDTIKIAKTAVIAALSRRAENVKLLDLRELKAFADFFVICSGSSDRQVTAIADRVLKEVDQEHDQRPWHREGQRKDDWILLDYVDLVVHIFDHDAREFYNLERLWADAIDVELPEIAEDQILNDDYSDLDFDDLEFDDDAFDFDFDDEKGL